MPYAPPDDAVRRRAAKPRPRPRGGAWPGRGTQIEWSACQRGGGGRAWAAGRGAAARARSHRDEPSSGSAPIRAERASIHERVSLRAAVQAEHWAAAASLRRRAADRPGQGAAGDQERVDRSRGPGGGFPDAQSFHHGVPALHRRHTERVQGRLAGTRRPPASTRARRLPASTRARGIEALTANTDAASRQRVA